MIRIIPLALLLLFCQISYSQTDTTSHSKQKKPKKEKKVFPMILPAIASNPTSGLMYGVAASVTWYMGPPEFTHLSESMASIIYTTKKQSINLIKSNVVLKNDSWILKGDWRVFFSSAPTYGLGTGPQSAKPVGTGIEYQDNIFSEPIPDAQMMEYNLIRFHETVMKRIGDGRFFVGLGYHLDYHYDIKDNLLDLDTNPPVITSHYAYSINYGFDPERDFSLVK